MRTTHPAGDLSFPTRRQVPYKPDFRYQRNLISGAKKLHSEREKLRAAIKRTDSLLGDWNVLSCETTVITEAPEIKVLADKVLSNKEVGRLEMYARGLEVEISKLTNLLDEKLALAQSVQRFGWALDKSHSEHRRDRSDICFSPQLTPAQPPREQGTSESTERFNLGPISPIVDTRRPTIFPFAKSVVVSGNGSDILDSSSSNSSSNSSSSRSSSRSRSRSRSRSNTSSADSSSFTSIFDESKIERVVAAPTVQRKGENLAYSPTSSRSPVKIDQRLFRVGHCPQSPKDSIRRMLDLSHPKRLSFNPRMPIDNIALLLFHGQERAAKGYTMAFKQNLSQESAVPVDSAAQLWRQKAAILGLGCHAVAPSEQSNSTASKYFAAAIYSLNAR